MITTKNFVEIPVDEGMLIFHKWFGNPIILDIISFNNFKNSCFNELNIELKNELIEHNFIIDNIENEYQLFKDLSLKNSELSLTGGKIKQLDLIVSEGCNLGCPHCIYFAGNERENDVNSKMNIQTAVDTWAEFLKIARENLITEFDVHFGGAEPLLNWSLVKNILEVFPNSLTENESIIWSINTNVTLVTDSIAKEFKKHNVAVHTSLDGDKNANDRIRMKIGGQGTFDLICEKIKLLRNYDLEVLDLSLTITSDNFDHINLEFISWLKDFGIKGLGVDIDLVSCKNISPKQAATKISDIFWKCYELGIECSGTWMTAFLNIVNRDIRKDHVAFCGAIKGHIMSVTPKGEIKLCPYMSTKVGNVNNISELFKVNSKFQELIIERQPGYDIHCNNCILEASCGGQCHITKEEALRKDNFESYNKMCSFYREITILMLTLYSNYSKEKTIIF